MKKTTILLLLSFIIFISSITAAGHIHVSGNTFTIPSDIDNKENNPYHTYNIDNNKKKKQTNQNNNKNYKNNNNNSVGNTSSSNNTNYRNNNNLKNSIQNNNSKKYTKKKTINNNKTTNSKKTSSRKSSKKNTITKIEFSKHFIKIPLGTSENILFKTTPDKTSVSKFIYKSSDNSIAIFKDKKLTGIKKGFTTILIMLPEGTVKAACPVKVI